MLISVPEIFKKYNITPAGILHIGAHHAQEARTYASLGVENVIWVEADDKTASELAEKIKPYIKNKSYCFAASDVDGEEVDFYIASNGESSSLLEMEKHMVHHPHITIAGQKKVLTKRIDTFFEEENLDSKDYNFVMIDVQGAELLALNGMKKSLENIDYIYTEVNDAEIYKNCAKMNEVDEFLSKYNFKRVETNMSIYEWGDAFYIKRE